MLTDSFLTHGSAEQNGEVSTADVKLKLTLMCFCFHVQKVLEEFPSTCSDGISGEEHNVRQTDSQIEKTARASRHKICFT